MARGVGAVAPLQPRDAYRKMLLLLRPSVPRARDDVRSERLQDVQVLQIKMP